MAARDRLDPYEAAWLSGGAERMAMTAIVALTERGVLLPPGKPSERGPRPPIPVNCHRGAALRPSGRGGVHEGRDRRRPAVQRSHA